MNNRYKVFSRSCVICGQTMEGVGWGTKYCPECSKKANAKRHREYSRNQCKAKKSKSLNRSRPDTSDAALRLNSNVADWAGISYGQLMLKSPAEREALILAYKAAKGCITHE